MVNMNSEIKKVIRQVRNTQSKFQALLKNQSWIEEVRKYAELQGTEVKKLIAADVTRVKNFLVRERKELERFQKQLPNEVKKVRNLFQNQRKEFGKLIFSVRKATLGKRTPVQTRSKKTNLARKKPTVETPAPLGKKDNA